MDRDFNMLKQGNCKGGSHIKYKQYENEQRLLIKVPKSIVFLDCTLERVNCFALFNFNRQQIPIGQPRVMMLLLPN